MQKFNQMEYRRPDMESVKKEFGDWIDKLSKAESAQESKEILLHIEDGESDLSTAASLAYIRNTMNTNDEFYENEVSFFNEALPQLVPYRKRYLETLLETPYRPQLEEWYGTQMFVKAQTELRVQDERIMPDLVVEANLCTEYQKLVAGCKTNFRGEECNFYGLLKHMESPDRQERKEAFLAWAGMYEKVADQLDGIFDKLVAVRCEMAKKLNLESFTQKAYLDMQRTDYNPEDVARFREQVLKVIVPACVKIRERQAKRIGVDKLKYYDEGFILPEGNPEPIGNKDAMVGWAGEMYRDLSPETGEFFDYMTQYELFDLETRPGKHMGGYCTYLPAYKAPFIFSNFNGTLADVDTLTHEAGHAFQYYLSSRTLPLAQSCHATTEICEIHSMTMEHFTYPWMGKFFGEQSEKYRYAHLANSLTFIPYIVCVDEFQHRLYEKPEMSASQRRSLWREIEQKYMPWRDYDGVEMMEEGGFWMQKQHIFLNPFYYIDYSLAQMSAFELYGRMKSDRQAAWEDYMRLCKAGGSKGFRELLKLANLSNPFEEGSVAKAVNHVLKEMESSPWN